MIWLDRKYTMLVSSRLTLFKQKKSDLFNFRCIFCGDSQKNTSKARGYIYCKNGKYFFGCHNCGKGLSFSSFLKHIDPSLHKEYLLEQFKENLGSSKKDIFENVKFDTPKFTPPVFDIPRLSNLELDHSVIKYVSKRKIPRKYWNLLYYTENFKEFVESVSDTVLSDYESKPRLIIPFFNRNNQVIAFQGRALDNYSIRYITIKFTEELKIYGAERIRIDKPIKVVEGPIDSLFLENCIATADSDLSNSSNIFDKRNLILIPDCQPRNKSIVEIIERKFINENYTVCLLPDDGCGKDINEYILNGVSKREVENIIKNNTFSGLRLKLEFNRWRKI